MSDQPEISPETENATLRAEIARLTKERDEARCAMDEQATLQNQSDMPVGSYWKLEIQRDEALNEADHYKSVWEKVSAEYQVTLLEIRKLTDQLDLNRDEFLRVITTLSQGGFNDHIRTEAIGICERSQKVIEQNIPVIEQRNIAEKRAEHANAKAESYCSKLRDAHGELAALRAEIATLKETERLIRISIQAGDSPILPEVSATVHKGFGLQREVFALEKEIFTLRTRAEHAEKERDEATETFLVARGILWSPPTAWAYAQICRVKDSLRARVERLEGALRTFGEHRANCRIHISCVCSCGLDAALAAPSSEDLTRKEGDEICATETTSASSTAGTAMALHAPNAPVSSDGAPSSDPTDAPERRAKLSAWVDKCKAGELRNQEPFFMDFPERWQVTPTYACENGHVSHRYLKSEYKGSLCLTCHAPLFLIPPEIDETMLLAILEPRP